MAAAAARELQEETSLYAREEDMKLVHLLHCKAGDDGGEWLGAFFEAERWSGDPSLAESDKHDGIGWHLISQLPANIIPYTKQGIELSQQNVPFSSYGW